MSHFDVFINGVQPKHASDTQHIIERVSKGFKVDHEKALKIIKTPHMLVKKGVSKELSEKMQKSFSAIGLICTCRPSSGGDGLLLDIADDKLDQCPNCKKQLIKKEGAQDKCTHCGVIIERFLEIEAEKAEKNEIRSRLVKKQSTRLIKERQAKEAMQEELRKQRLEEEVLKESPYLKEKKKQRGLQQLLILGGFSLVAVAGYYAIMYIDQSNRGGDPSVIVAQQGGGQGMDTGIPMDPDSPLSSQDALKNTHDQAAQVFNAFGLDPDALANIPSAMSEEPLLSTQNSAGTTNNNSTFDVKAGASSLTLFLANFGANDDEWESYLTRKLKGLVTSQRYSKARQILSYLRGTEDFITQAALFSKVTDNTINTAIDTKIKSAPSGFQAEYFALAAQHQSEANRANALFGQAEKAWSTIESPKRKLLSALKIGVAYFKSGNKVTANRYFSEIKGLLSQVGSTEGQVEVRTAISHAFHDVGQTQVGLKWLQSTSKFSVNSNRLSLQRVVEGYAYLGQVDKALSTIKGASSSQFQDVLFYQAISVSLESGLYTNVNGFVDDVQAPENKALTYLLIASYVDDNSDYLASAEALLNSNINDSSAKAIVLSRLARQYASQKNQPKVSELFQQTKYLIGGISPSASRDELLAAAATNYAYALERSSALNLLSLIKSPAVKARVSRTISQMVKFSTLLK